MKNVYVEDGPSIWRAAFLAPLVAPFVAAILLALTDPAVSIVGALIYFPIIFVVSAGYAYFGVWLIGIPTAIFLRRRRSLSALRMYFVGLAGGEALWFVPRLVREPLSFTQVELNQALLCGGVSIAVAVLFCALSGIPIRSSRPL